MVPEFLPEQDAPIHIGQPGEVGSPEMFPRSPHKRVLPQTPETLKGPGIWAGDGAHASSKDTPGMLLGLVLPYPDDATTPGERAPAEICADLMNKAADEAVPAETLQRLSKEERHCLAARMYHRCAVYFLQHDMAGIESGEHYDREHSKGVDGLVERAGRLADEECKTLPIKHDVINGLVQRSFDAMRAKFRGGAK